VGHRVEVGRPAVNRLRDHLTRQLAKKIQAHGLVIWEDDGGEYRDVASTVAPDGVRFEAFDGSWYELRHRIEDTLAGDRPTALVVYGPAPPDDDPLAETRAAGAEFTRKLSTLVRQALTGQLTEGRISEIARKARTLAEAEAAVAGDSNADVRLISLFGTSDTTRMFTMVLTGEADSRLDEATAWPAVSDLSRDAVGASVEGSGDRLRDALFRHLLLTELGLAGAGELPTALAHAWQPGCSARQRTAVEVLDRLRGTREGMRVYRRLASDADEALSLSVTLPWQPGIDTVVGTEATERTAFTEATRLLDTGNVDAARSIAEGRLANSPWAADPTTGWGPRWRAVDTVAYLRSQIHGAPLPSTPAGMLSWYAEQGWKVDRAHRRLELARTELGVFGELEQALTAARAAYDEWLDALLTRFTSSLADGALDPGQLVRQGDVHQRFVAAGPPARTAYVWVDALRYELGVELVEALRPVAEGLTIEPAVAAAPTITPVGMANLLPDAASMLRVGLDGDQISVTVGATTVKDVPARRNLLRARHGSVADLDLNDAAQKGEKALANAIGNADLVLLRSQEVDAAGESGLLSVAWSHFETVINLLASVVARLAQAGVERVVISADHGFIALGQDLGSQRVVDVPAGAAGTTKRRVFVGRGGVPNPATVRVPLAACGVTSDLDIVVPRGLAVFKAGGGRQFFHGGLSPQELVIPVIVVDLAKAPEPQKLQVSVHVAGDRITTGVFAAALSFSGDLFTDRLTVRVVAAEPAGQPVARVVSGDGYEPESGAITVSTGRPSVLTFQVTANLATGDDVDLQVLDARTGRKLAASTVAVSAHILVEDSLD
jgi:hypothetical protein